MKEVYYLMHKDRGFCETPHSSKKRAMRSITNQNVNTSYDDVTKKFETFKELGWKVLKGIIKDFEET